MILKRIVSPSTYPGSFPPLALIKQWSTPSFVSIGEILFDQLLLGANSIMLDDKGLIQGLF